MYNTPLEAKIVARNKANTVAMELYPKLAAVFAPYLGKKIENADGSLVAKLAKEVKTVLDQYSGQGFPNIYRYNSRYSIVYVVKTCETSKSGYSEDHGHAQYAEESVYIVDMTNKAKLYEPRDRKTDYKVEDIEAARAEVNAARAVLQVAESKLAGFGEYDQ